MLPPALAACLLLAAAPAAAAEWVRVETPNFVVFGEPGERRVREVAEQFERFREALGRVIPGAAAPAAVPTAVVVFASARSFQPYIPRFNGKPMKLGGYFFASDDMNVVAMADGSRDDAMRTVFHEYLHVVIDNISPRTPLWLNEGLAEYYSTFQVVDSGREALTGRVIVPHLQLLNERKPLSIAELLAVDTTSPVYNEGQRQSLFYAQSWALVHMLLSGTTNRSDNVTRYARLVANGETSFDAWSQVFGDADIIRELTRYVAQNEMKGVLYRFDTDIPPVKSYSSKLSEGDVEAILGDLLRRVASADVTTARFEKAIAIQPPSARARALFGLFLLENNREDKARQLLMEAAGDATDWLVQYHVATGLTWLVSTTDDRPAPVVDTARSAIERVLGTRPTLANAHAMAARLDTAEDLDRPETLESIRRARATSPGRQDYAVLEAFILMRSGDLAGARRLATPLTEPNRPDSVRKNARSLLEEVARLEQLMTAYVARLEARTPSAPQPAASSSRTVPMYRRVEPGESRVEGLLERIDCTSSGIVLQVSVEGKIERFNSPSLTSVAFISHRDDLGGGIECSARTPPDRVYITWKTDGESDRRTGPVVAVEFLPPRRE